ncbi:lytic murein transglycosylase B [Rugamonas sp. CCM 8940]|uniref:lytic murein transglycosylase B n=1 Tax=Rugamonas sp. CCM 8940 TaxID=2765359 RepID=UPI0018F2A30D|nr:lytic murein transglycosylase B [Rugamonas sp. CCM 8940]MBJ7308652.1 lytic murein transglycosylase B [Rugamonas sp. CCM 8940]
MTSLLRHLPLRPRHLLALLLAAAPFSQALAIDQYGYKLPPSKQGKAKAKQKKGPPPIDYNGEFVNFGQWKEVRLFIDGMVEKHGFQRAEVEALMGQVRFVESAVQLIKPAPPGKPKNWQAYSKQFIEPVRIDAGVKFWNENRDALTRAQELYGVPAEILVGIIGVETVYGRNTGRFRVLDALTTLAFSYPEAPSRAERMAFFRGELEATLLFARQNGVDPLALRGSYAGAVGMPQFMPSSIMKYAVDFDGDGRIDLLNSTNDAIGSVAAFLVAHGWQRATPGPLVIAANVSPSRSWEPLLERGLSANFLAPDLLAAGVNTTSALPADVRYGLVDLQNGAEATEYWLATNNFFAITQYNRSYFYAMSVVELGRAVKLSRGGDM